MKCSVMSIALLLATISEFLLWGAADATWLIPLIGVSICYNEGILRQANQTDDFLNDTVKIILVKSSYTPNKDHDRLDDITSHEVDVAGYTGGFGGAGRKTLGSKTITKDDANDRVKVDAADPTAWTLDTGNTHQYAVAAKEITNDAGSIPYCALDYGAKVTNGGDFTLQFHADGLWYYQQ